MHHVRPARLQSVDPEPPVPYLRLSNAIRRHQRATSLQSVTVWSRTSAWFGPDPIASESTPTHTEVPLYLTPLEESQGPYHLEPLEYDPPPSAPSSEGARSTRI
jgi:hypothetical protein